MSISNRNPYTPGAAHAPPYLAGRDDERRAFRRLLEQDVILENVVLSGVRGIGKTALLREFYKRDALERGWLWAESDVSESVSSGESQLLTRIFTDLGVITGGWVVHHEEISGIGFNPVSETREIRADSRFWQNIADNTPGLNSDKLKKVLTVAWQLMQTHQPKKRGIVFAYDEAQNFDDNSARDQYPLSLLLEAFVFLQRQKIRFMLVLTGLPPLHSKLVAARTYAERMFRVVVLDHLSPAAADDAIMKPLSKSEPHIRSYFESIKEILYDFTGGYPYFIQYWCYALYDYVMSAPTDVNINIVKDIRERLDSDFFAARWEHLTDRQRDLLLAAANVSSRNDTGEFSVQATVSESGKLPQPFKPSHANQMLTELAEKGMVFKSRHGKYLFAVPMLGDYIRRRHSVDFETTE